jgi:hypothetical protein
MNDRAASLMDTVVPRRIPANTTVPTHAGIAPGCGCGRGRGLSMSATAEADKFGCGWSWRSPSSSDPHVEVFREADHVDVAASDRLKQRR